MARRTAAPPLELLGQARFPFSIDASLAKYAFDHCHQSNISRCRALRRRDICHVTSQQRPVAKEVRGRPVSRILSRRPASAPPWMTIPLTMPLPTQLQPPTRTCWSERGSAAAPEDTDSTRSLFGVAPGGACHAAAVTSRAVGSYPTVSPLPDRGPKQALD